MRRGEVVEVDWPYSDLTESKKRPAVVVQADFLNGPIGDTILVQIAGTRHGIPGTEALLDPFRSKPAARPPGVGRASKTRTR
jgi:mRNA-degrading endonuclease toxin of MazEF toxin-antitoxin module